jgi:hypothetical protein
MKKIFLGLVAVIVVALLAAASMPKNFIIEQEIIINKPRVMVFDYLKMTKTNSGWNPWMQKDPNVVQTFTGEEGTVGFINAWSGNKEIGVGEQEVVDLIPNERIDLELRFAEPMKITHKSHFTTEAIDESQTKVTWVMEGKTPFPYNLICFFMQKQLKKEFAEGLSNLKTVLEVE